MAATGVCLVGVASVGFTWSGGAGDVRDESLACARAGDLPNCEPADTARLTALTTNNRASSRLRHLNPNRFRVCTCCLSPPIAQVGMAPTEGRRRDGFSQRIFDHSDAISIKSYDEARNCTTCP